MYQYIANQDEVLSKIINDINNKQDSIIIHGKSGSGKTYVLKQVEKNYFNRSVFWLKGDFYLKNKDYYPFLDFIAQIYSNQSNIRKTTIRKKNVNDIAGNIGSISPIGSDLISSAIKKFMNYSIEEKELTNYFSSKEELEILFQLEYFCNSDADAIFLCDDLQYWDAKSIQFLYTLLKGGKAQNKILNSSAIVMSFTIDTAYENNVDSLYKLAASSVYRLNCVESQSYHTVLKQLGLKTEIDDSLYIALYSITNGNLQLSNDIVILLNHSLETVDETIEDIITNENLGQLLIDRLENNQHGMRINNVLKYASLFGNTFRFLELENILNLSEGSIRDIIQDAEALLLVKGESNSASFIHELIRKAYKESILNDSENYYSKYSQCIKIIYPGNYPLRAESLYLAGEYEQANIMAIIAYLNNLRANLVQQDDEGFLFQQTPNYLEDYILSMKIAYKHFNKGDYKQCYDELDSIEDIFPPVLLAEKNYLLSVTLSKWLTADCRQKARVCLIPYLQLDYIDNEIEIWERILSVYIVACIHDNKRKDAMKYEKLFSVSITKRIGYDFNASCKLNIYRRKYAMIYNESKTFIAAKKSKDFFSSNRDKVLDPLQFYMSMSNFLAAALKNGKNGELMDEITHFLAFPQSYSNLKFQRMEIPLNNIVIISFINEQLSAEEAISNLEAILERYDLEESTSTIIESNISVLYCLSGDFTEGYNRMLRLYQQISTLDNLEFYYEYLITRNLSALKFLINEKEEAIEMLFRILKNENILYRESFLLQTKALLENIKESSCVTDSKVWYTQPLTYPISSHNIPDYWGYYGKKYLFGELEFWSES